jgi:hypothetical protein
MSHLSSSNLGKAYPVVENTMIEMTECGMRPLKVSGGGAILTVGSKESEPVG